ncbi:type III secretion system translocon subunit SctE, partial [Salmonella enterica]|nr:type III secretion system translocon subunit SctE [Salmonella enterica]
KEEKFLLDDFCKKVLSKIFKKIICALIRDYSFKSLQAIRCATEGGNQANAGVIKIDKAKLEKKIEQLIAQQQFLEFIMEQTEGQKKMEQKRLQALYKDSGTAVKDTLDTIDSYSSVQARMAGWRA